MKKLSLTLILLLINPLVAVVHASSSFYGSSAIDFGLTGDLTDIAVSHSGGYLDLGSMPAGDSVALPQYQFSGLPNAGFNFGFQVNDSLGGTASSAFQGNFILSFSNTGNQIRQFDLNVGYALQADVNGEYADGLLQLEYGLTGYEQIYVENFGQPSLSINGSSGAIGFSLAAGQTVDFLVSVTMTSNLLGTTPVPLPSSFVLFSFALLIFKRVWLSK